MFYEIIYETGNYSVAMYSNDEEAIRAISEHHRRATSGEPAQASNPQMGPAERISKVLRYDVHPQDLHESQAMPVSDVTASVQEAIEGLAMGDMISVPELAAAVRTFTSPTVNSGAHESNYKMDEVGSLSPSDWDNSGNKAGEA